MCHVQIWVLLRVFFLIKLSTLYILDSLSCYSLTHIKNFNDLRGYNITPCLDYWKLLCGPWFWVVVFFFNLNVMHVVVSKLYRYTIWLFHFGYCELNWRVFYYFRVIIRDKKLTKHHMLQSKYLCIKDMFLFKTVCEH